MSPLRASLALLLCQLVVTTAAPAVASPGEGRGARRATTKQQPRRPARVRQGTKSSRPAGTTKGTHIGTARSHARTRILDEARATLRGSPHVRLVPARFAAAAKELRASTLPSWNDELPASLRTGRLEDVAYYLFVLNSVNYRFWERGPTGEMVRWKNGSASLAELFVKLHDAGKLPGMHVPPKDVRRTVSRALGRMPDREGRLAHLEDVARRGAFERLFATANRNGTWHLTADLAEKLAEAFPTYRDPYLKRAQLTLGMIGGHFASRGERVSFGLTAYADYRVPQVLRHLGVIELSPELSSRVARGEVIEKGGAEERAIRAATVLAVARLARETGMSDPAIDAALFLVSRTEAFRQAAAPHHLTPTRDY